MTDDALTICTVKRYRIYSEEVRTDERERLPGLLLGTVNVMELCSERVVRVLPFEQDKKAFVAAVSKCIQEMREDLQEISSRRTK